MRILGPIVLISLAVLAIFAAVNWNALTSPAALSFVVVTLDAPLGLILLGFALGFALSLVGYAATQRATMFMESRRHAHEIKVQREIAERVEASRVHELRLQLEREVAALRTSIEEAANGLAASIGQVDDKLDRALQRPAESMVVASAPGIDKAS